MAVLRYLNRLLCLRFQRIVIGHKVWTVTGLLTFISLLYFVSFKNTVNVDEMLDVGEAESNETWSSLRRERLQQTNLSKVVIFAYMRGGSSLLSEIFNLDPFSILWHEPIDAFYQAYAGLEPHSIPLTLLYLKNHTRRLRPESEQNQIVNYVNSLLSCRSDRIPLETFAHFHTSYSSALQRITTCMETMKSTSLVHNCTLPLQPICGFADLIRRDMEKNTRNKCPQIISTLKSTTSSADSLFIRDGGNKNFMFKHQSAINKDGLKIDQNDSLRDAAIKDLLKTTENSSSVDLNDESKRNVHLLINHYICMSEVKSILNKCIEPSAHDICRNAKLSALKLVRLFMSDLTDVIRDNPDILVIFYVRDPRAIAQSRSSPGMYLTMSNSDRSVVAETKILCSKMRDDIEAKKLLEQKFPGSVVTIRYEDFIAQPTGTAESLFKKIGQPVPKEIQSWIQSRFKGTLDNGVYGTIRSDPIVTSNKWMTLISLRDAIDIEKNCHDVLDELGYARTLYRPTISDSVELRS